MLLDAYMLLDSWTVGQWTPDLAKDRRTCMHSQILHSSKLAHGTCYWTLSGLVGQWTPDLAKDRHTCTPRPYQSLLMLYVHVILHSSKIAVHVLLTLHIACSWSFFVIIHGGPYFTGRMGTGVPNLMGSPKFYDTGPCLLTHMHAALLIFMDSFLFCFTIPLSVIEVRCL